MTQNNPCCSEMDKAIRRNGFISTYSDCLQNESVAADAAWQIVRFEYGVVYGMGIRFCPFCGTAIEAQEADSA